MPGISAYDNYGLSLFNGVDDTPVDGETAAPISSNWAFDHEGDTSTHGVTTVDGVTERDAAIAVHAAAIDAHVAEMLATLNRGLNILYLPTNTGWTATVVGSGETTQQLSNNRVDTSATASSSALLYTESLKGFDSAQVGTTNSFNYGLKTYFVFNYVRYVSDAEVVARVQLKTVSTIGALAALGLGIRVDNLELVGESYGASLDTVALQTLVSAKIYQIVIILYPGASRKIEWWVDGVLKGTQSTVAKVPSGDDIGQMVHSIARGTTGATLSYSYLMQPRILQVR